MVGANGREGRPIVKPLAVSTYNMVRRGFPHPEVLPALVNLFYDVFYSDDAETRYGPDATAAGGFYHNQIPVRVWNAGASIFEYHRVRGVFDDLWEAGYRFDFTSQAAPPNAATAAENNAEIARLNADTGPHGEIFNRLRTREKALHFARGWHYFQAYMEGTPIRDMYPRQRDGWGIYNTMICRDGGYAYVADLHEDRAEAKYNMFYGTATPAMQSRGAFLATQFTEIFTAVFLGNRTVTNGWNHFNNTYNNNGGPLILSEVNEWFASRPIEEDAPANFRRNSWLMR